MDCERHVLRPGVRHRSNVPVSKTEAELLFGSLDELEELEIEKAFRIAEQLKGGSR